MRTSEARRIVDDNLLRLYEIKTSLESQNGNELVAYQSALLLRAIDKCLSDPNNAARELSERKLITEGHVPNGMRKFT